MIEAYDSDLTMTQQEFSDPLITLAKIGARLRTTDMMSVLNAIFYVVVTDCQWRQLSHDFPYWSAVYSYFRMWRKDGTCCNLNEHLRMQVRVNDGRASHIVTQRKPMQSLELYCEALKPVPITQSSEIVEPALEIFSNLISNTTTALIELRRHYEGIIAQAEYQSAQAKAQLEHIDALLVSGLLQAQEAPTLKLAIAPQEQSVIATAIAPAIAPAAEPTAPDKTVTESTKSGPQQFLPAYAGKTKLEAIAGKANVTKKKRRQHPECDLGHHR